MDPTWVTQSVVQSRIIQFIRVCVPAGQVVRGFDVVDAINALSKGKPDNTATQVGAAGPVARASAVLQPLGLRRPLGSAQPRGASHPEAQCSTQLTCARMQPPLALQADGAQIVDSGQLRKGSIVPDLTLGL